MVKKDSEKRNGEKPQYTIADIMALLDVEEHVVREFLVDAGVDVESSKNDPTERIAYPDYRKLWISRANRPEGRLLAKLLVEESTSWASSMFNS